MIVNIVCFLLGALVGVTLLAVICCIVNDKINEEK